MKVWVVSAWHNEERLAPFFLSHYAWADSIVLFIGSDTTDASRAIATRFSNVEIRPTEFPGGLLDDEFKIDVFNQLVPEFPADWVLALDADELIFPPNGEDSRTFLERQAEATVINANMYQVYRHRSEGPLDACLPAVSQRRHGPGGWHHNKPCIVRPEAQIVWEIGHHGLRQSGRIKIAEENFIGAHWAFADEEIAVERYIRGRSQRMSKANREKGHGFHTHRTAESILTECESHLDDLELF